MMEVQKQGTKIIFCLVFYSAPLGQLYGVWKTAGRQYGWSLLASGKLTKMAVLLGTWSCVEVCSVIYILNAKKELKKKLTDSLCLFIGKDVILKKHV
jgi:hypothetical protein